MFVFDRIRFVLVGTQHPGNIGAAARAMKTMGLKQLALVAPEKPLDEGAYRRSAGAEEILSQAPVFSDLAQAVSDCHLVMGCSARERRIQPQLLTPEIAAQQILACASTGGQVALVFGRERSGLSNTELQLCHASVHIPSDPEFSSLNLAAAVQVLAWELRRAQLVEQKTESTSPLQPPITANHQQLEGFFTQLAAILEQIDFHKGRAPNSALYKLRRLFLRAHLTEHEVRLLRGILTDTQRTIGLSSTANRLK